MRRHFQMGSEEITPSSGNSDDKNAFQQDAYRPQQ